MTFAVYRIDISHRGVDRVGSKY